MSSFAIKMLAMLTMLIDHIGAAFALEMPYSVYLLCRTVGRLAMPLFCFMIAEGLFHTRDAKKYMIRLALFALISEVPFDRLFMGSWLEFSYQNVGFTLLLGLLGILLFDSFAAQGRKTAALLAILATGIAATLIRSDYMIFGVYYVFIFYYFRGHKYGIAAALAVGVLLQATSSLMGGDSWQMALASVAAVTAAIPIGLYSGKRGRDSSLLRMVFYAFYPVHLLLLYVATLFINTSPQ